MPLDADLLTWAGLLAKWMEFAQASVALPDDAGGRAWKRSVTPIIELQAVTCALGELNTLPADEMAVARDKAEIIIDRAAAQLGEIWGGEGAPLPEEITLIISDSRATLAASRAQASM